MPTQILVTQNIDQHSTQATPINNPIKIKYLLGIIIVQVVLVTRRHLFYYNHCIYLYSIQLMLTRVPMKAEFRISSSAPEYIHKRRKRLRNTTLTPITFLYFLLVIVLSVSLEQTSESIP